MAKDSKKIDRLDEKQADLAVGAIGSVVEMGAELPHGLRAISEEMDDRRVARTLLSVADRLEQGSSLSQISQEVGARMPRHVAGLLEGLEFGGFGGGQATVSLAGLGGESGASRSLSDESVDGFSLLTRSVAHHQRYVALLRKLRRALLYPATLTFFAILLLGLFGMPMVTSINNLYAEFEIEVPNGVRGIQNFFGFGLWWMFGIYSVMYFLFLFGNLVVPRGMWDRVVSTLPVFGRAHLWYGVSEMTGTLSLLLKRRTSQPDAFRICKDGLRSHAFRAECSRFEEQSKAGQSLDTIFRRSRLVPPTVMTFVRGREGEGLCRNLNSVSEIYWKMTERRVELLKLVIPPLMVILVGVLIAFYIVSVLVPASTFVRMIGMF